MPVFGTTDDLFEKAIALEKSFEALYRQMAEMFSAEEGVARFWERYADEERGHATYLERARGKASPETLAAPGNAAMLELVQKLLDHSVENMLVNVTNLDDAYQLAIELENSETNVVFDFMLSNFSSYELSQSLAFLRIQLNKHVSAIENEFPTKYKSKLMRQGVLPKFEVVK